MWEPDRATAQLGFYSTPVTAGCPHYGGPGQTSLSMPGCSWLRGRRPLAELLDGEGADPQEGSRYSSP